eukprot:scaffold2038_cov117-Skeletonema_dohrnii-CCMP3373.AAC.4
MKRTTAPVYARIDSVTYDMEREIRYGASEWACGRLRCLIRSPTTLKRRRYEHTMLELCMLELCKRCFYTLSWPTILGHWKQWIAIFTA